MISNNYIPEKINDANAYLDGTRMIGVAASVDLPEINMKTGTVEGFGIGGEVDSPTIGQWESFEQAVQFNTLYSSAVDMLSPMSVVNLISAQRSRCTTRAAAMTLRACAWSRWPA